MLLSESFLLHVLVFVIGAAAAAGEIMTRYRDEPFSALRNWPGGLYLLFNGLIALFAYGFFGFDSGEPGGAPKPAFADNLALNAIAVGTGAMLILRSRLFTIRSESGNATAFGPAIVIDAFLGVLDRKIDRLRASKRHKLVFDQLKDIDNFDGTVTYFQMSLLSFQNLSQQEKADINQIVNEYRNIANWSPALKTMAVGFAILTIAGEENFSIFVKGLKGYLDAVKAGRQPSAPPPPIS